MYVEGVKRSSKYTIRANDIYAYNFLNIQRTSNPKRFGKLRIRAFQPSKALHVKACQRCQRSIEQKLKTSSTHCRNINKFCLLQGDHKF